MGGRRGEKEKYTSCCVNESDGLLKKCYHKKYSKSKNRIKKKGKNFPIGKMLNLNVILLIFSIVSNAKSVGDRENGFENRKRFDMGTETCIENFDIHIDKIIRTQDSRAMGAKYLNEADVNGREDCMKLCCETSLCDVFVMEQKVIFFLFTKKKLPEMLLQ